ncbi:MAG: DUF3667 domain-containing protein [Spartobacteria bacterium]
MSDETTPLILGDAAAAELGHLPGRKWLRRKKSARPPLTHCENCGALLTGPYCAQCGQPAIDYHRSFGSLLADAADAFFNFDARFFQSFGLLLGQPWRLTNEFVEGKRARHVHPLRVYLIASVIFFLVINFLSRDTHLETSKKNKGLITYDVTAPSPMPGPVEFDFLKDPGEDTNGEAEPAAPRPPLAPLNSPALKADRSSPSFSTSPPAAAQVSPEREHLFAALDRQKDRSALSQWVEQRAKEKIGPTGDRGDLFLKALLQNLGPMVLCCIPLFALVLKILYVFKRRFYIEHLVFALHTHAFVFLSTVTIIGIGFLLAWKAPAPFTPLVCTLLGFAVVIQLLRAIRKVYRQNWFATLFKFALGSLIYLVLLSVAFGITAFVTLALP